MFVVVVEIALFLTVFCDKEIDGAVVTAITIIAVLPILVMRAFDITSLNLTKEGITSVIAESNRSKTETLITDNPTKEKELSIKYCSVETGAMVTVQTDKFFLIEHNGKPYKLAIVE